MPNPGIPQSVYIETVKTVEEALRQGFTPPGQSSRTKISAINHAVSVLGLPEGTIRSRLKVARRNGLEPDWSLYNPLATEFVGVEVPGPESPAAKLRFTIRQPQDRWGDKYRVVAIFDAHDSPQHRKDRFEWYGRYIHDAAADMVVQIGDFFTFDSLSGFNRGLDTLESRNKPLFLEDIESGHEALAAFDKGLQGWAGDKHCTLGNHEDRALSRTNENPAFAGLVTHNLDNLFMSHGWTYSPFGVLHYIGGVAFTHVPLNRLGRPFGGEHIENQIGQRALSDVVYGHTHRAVDKEFSKIGTNRSVRVISGGCSLEHGVVEEYAKHTMTGWAYNIADILIDEGRVRRCTMVPMLDLEERYGDA